VADSEREREREKERERQWLLPVSSVESPLKFIALAARGFETIRRSGWNEDMIKSDNKEWLAQRSNGAESPH
jgi:hypothetical protein